MTVVAVLMGLVLSTPSQADPVVIQNASFEANVLADGAWQNPTTDWDDNWGTSAAGVYNPPGEPATPPVPSGFNVGFVNATASWHAQYLETTGGSNLGLTAGDTLSVTLKAEGGTALRADIRTPGNVSIVGTQTQAPGSGSYATLTYNFTIAKSEPNPLLVFDNPAGVQVRIDEVSATHTGEPTTMAYDPSWNTSAGFSNFTGTVGLVFTVDRQLKVTELGITTNSPAGGLDSSQLYTQMYRLNDPGGDISDATLLAERNFTQGLAETISGIAPWDWRGYFEAPDRPLELFPGETYIVASYGFGGSPLRRYINSPNNVLIASDINHLGSRWTNTPGAVPTVNDAVNLQYQGPTFRFAVVPEPSTLAIWALGLLGLAWYGWRRN